MMKDFMTMYWGRLPSTKSPYPLSSKVNAFVGRSGHGKTTIWDGLRLMLGDTKFENNRKLKNYVNPKSTWSIIRIGFDNLPLDNGVRPFERHRYKNDKIVACCHIKKDSEGEYKKEFYVFDGEFIDLTNLHNNPLAYRECLKQPEEYNKILRDCINITPSYRRLMAMDPATMVNLIGLTPNELFLKIFELLGLKSILKAYRDSKDKLNSIEVQLEQTNTQIADARLTQQKLLKEAAEFRTYQKNEAKVQDLDLMYNKLDYDILQKRIVELQNTVDVSQNELKSLSAKIAQSFAKQKEKEAENFATTQKCSEHQQEIKDIDAFLTDLAGTIAISKNIVENLNVEINKLEKIVPEDIETLRQLEVVASETLDETERLFYDEKFQLSEAKKILTQLASDQMPFPGFVKSFRNILEENQVPFVMLADAISVKPEYSKWQIAIEGYLAANRFRIVVDTNQYDIASDLQDKFKYRARLCTSRPNRSPMMSKTELTIWDAVVVRHIDKIGWYLNGIDDVYLVETPAEARKLQRKGKIAVTLNATIFDDDGSINREPQNLCCGKLALEAEKTKIQNRYKTLQEKVNNRKAICQNQKAEHEQIKKDILLQQERANLPSKYAEKQKNIDIYETATNEQNVKTLQKENINSEIAALQEQLRKIAGDIVRIEKEREATEKTASEIDDKIKLAFSEIGKTENRINEVRDLLLESISLADIEFISFDVQEHKFKNELGEPLSLTDIRKRITDCNRDIRKFKDEYPETNESVLLHEMMNKRSVDELQEIIDTLIEARTEWLNKSAEHLEILRNHVKEGMKRYINHFVMYADLLQANAKGNCHEVSDNPENWELHMSIGYDGKKAVPIDDPDLSSGQKACTSLMLLLSAVNNRKKGESTPIMFLDEPCSRVDDERGNEVGQILQLTDVQYFVTHQQGESLKTIDWIDHSFTCVKASSDDAIFAPPIKFAQKRRGTYAFETKPN